MIAFLAMGALVLSPAAPADDPPRIEIVVRIDPAIHRIEASATVPVETPASGEVVFELASSLEVSQVLRDGDRVAFEVTQVEGSSGLSRVAVRARDRAAGTHRYTLRYAGTIHAPPTVAQFSRERIADQTAGTIQEEGVFLSPEAGWYPRDGKARRRFRLEAQLPAGWDAVAEGSLAAREENAQGIRVVYDASHPTEGLHLVAGKWRRVERDHGGVKVAAYVVPDDLDLAEPYLAATERYLDLYAGWLGPYAYDRFAVVENFFSTGYGMAGFTVLGQDVMRLPFIVDTSLGHEVAHGWWGNGVFVSPGGGNWCEGLTTYVADYQYKRMQGAAAAAEYRREVCRDYTNYVSEAGTDFALTEFTERTTPASRAVGYGKTMMLFHMLETRLGKEKFDAALRRVYRENAYHDAGWDTWRAAMSKEAGEDLGWFFDQWVARGGAPTLEVKDVVAKAGEAYEVTGSIVRKGGAWRLEVPVVVEGDGVSERRVVSVSGESTPLRIQVPFPPVTLRVDPDQDVFRRLDPAEMPPVLSKLLGDPGTIFVVDDTSGDELRAAYAEMAATLTRSGMGKTIDASKATPEDLKGKNVLVLGYPGTKPPRDVLTGLPSETAVTADGFSVSGTAYAQPGASLLAVGRNPSDPSKAAAIFRGLSADAVRAAGRKLVHYGKYSYLAFVDGKNVAKGVARVEDGPLVVRLGTF